MNNTTSPVTTPAGAAIGDPQSRDPFNRKDRRLRRRKMFILGLVMILVPVALMLLQYQFYRVKTPVMTQGLRTGELTIVDRSAHGGRGLRRGDIVLIDGSYWPSGVPGFPYLERVVAIGGDTVACCDTAGHLTINGNSITEPYANGSTSSFGPFTATVPTGRVFVLGDSRNTSADSRAHLNDPDHGTIDVHGITGRVAAAISPLTAMRFTSSGDAFKPIDGSPRSTLLNPVLYEALVLLAGLTLVVIASRQVIGHSAKYLLAPFRHSGVHPDTQAEKPA